MKISRKILIPILVSLLIITFALLFIIKSEKDVEDICIIPIVGTIPRVIKAK